jgi:hypothetical protein
VREAAGEHDRPVGVELGRPVFDAGDVAPVCAGKNAGRGIVDLAPARIEDLRRAAGAEDQSSFGSMKKLAESMVPSLKEETVLGREPESTGRPPQAPS